MSCLAHNAMRLGSVVSYLVLAEGCANIIGCLLRMSFLFGIIKKNFNHDQIFMFPARERSAFVWGRLSFLHSFYTGEGLNMTVTLPQPLDRTEYWNGLPEAGGGANPKDLRKDKSIKFYPKWSNKMNIAAHDVMCLSIHSKEGKRGSWSKWGINLGNCPPG